MSPVKRLALFAALFAAQLALAVACHAQTVLAESHDSYGTRTLLTDMSSDQTVAECDGLPMAVGVPPSGDLTDAVYGCWSIHASKVRVTYVLDENTPWTDEYPRDHFNLTPYGKSQQYKHNKGM